MTARRDPTQKQAGSDSYSLETFLDQTGQEELGEGAFDLESSAMLEVNLDGRVWAKAGAMIGYQGDVTFERRGLSEMGLLNWLKKKFSSEGATLMKAEGRGELYLADQGKKVTILRLERGDSITVNGTDVLAFEDSVTSDIQMMKKISGMASGGLFNIQLDGPGLVAITTHKSPLTLKVDRRSPIYTDPGATVAWSTSLEPAIHTDIGFKTLIGRGSGETFQLKFSGDGFVVLQPFEEMLGQRA